MPRKTHQQAAQHSFIGDTSDLLQYPSGHFGDLVSRYGKSIVCFFLNFTLSFMQLKAGATVEGDGGKPRIASIDVLSHTCIDGGSKLGM